MRRWAPFALLLCGLGLICAPFIADRTRAMEDDALIAAYESEVTGWEQEMIDGYLADARAYNAELSAHGDNFMLARQIAALADAAHRSEADGDERWFSQDGEARRQYVRYRALLDVSGSPIMGSLSIDALGLRVPIYHGTADEELQKGAGHLIGSSLPVGGPDTHCVIVAHSGLPNAELFSHLSDLRTGDVFTISVLNQKLAYEVDQMLVVTPDQTEALAIVEGQDLCTLVTCTPYGINSHRLLVRGHRIPLSENAATTPAPDERFGVMVGLSCLVVVGAGIAFAIRRRRTIRRTYRW